MPAFTASCSRGARLKLPPLTLRHGRFHATAHRVYLAVDPVADERRKYYDFGMMSIFQPTVKRDLAEMIFGTYEGFAKDICDTIMHKGVLSLDAIRITSNSTVVSTFSYFLG